MDLLIVDMEIDRPATAVAGVDARLRLRNEPLFRDSFLTRTSNFTDAA